MIRVTLHDIEAGRKVSFAVRDSRPLGALVRFLRWSLEASNSSTCVTHVEKEVEA